MLSLFLATFFPSFLYPFSLFISVLHNYYDTNKHVSTHVNCNENLTTALILVKDDLICTKLGKCEDDVCSVSLDRGR